MARFVQADLWGPPCGLPLKENEMQLWFPRERESLFFLAAINGWLRTGADKCWVATSGLDNR